jgi:hypothetical protein
MTRAHLISNRLLFRCLLLLVGALMSSSSLVSADTDTSKVKILWMHSTAPDYWPGDPDIPGLAFPQSLFLRWYDLDVDQAGNVYLLGRRQYLSDWRGHCLDAEECAKIHILMTKLDRHGHQQWSYYGDGRCDGGFRGHIRAGLDGSVFFTEELYVTWSFCPSYNTGTRIVGLGPSGNRLWEYRHEIPNSLTAGPAALTVGPWGQVYASSSDPISNRIAIFNPADASPGIVNLPFDWYYNSPLHTDGKGNLYAYGEGVAKFNSEGVLLRDIASPGGMLLGANIDRDGNSYCLWYLGNGYRFDKYDSNLTTVWSRTPPIRFGAERVYLGVEPSGTAVIWQRDAAIKYSPNGSIIWNNEWDIDEWRLWDLSVDRLGNIMTVGEYGDYADTFTVIRKFDPDGNMMWQMAMYNLVENTDVQIEMLRVDSHGDIYITAQLDPWPPEDTREAVVKLTQPKTLAIRDGNLDSIPNTPFYAIKVRNNRPTFGEDTLGQFTTNFRGQIELPFAGSAGYLLPASPLNAVADTLKFGDTIKIARLVYTEPAARHTSILGSMYSVNLDNAEFLADGSMVFDTVEMGSIQIVTLRHTEYRYNLLASIEWDAVVPFTEGLEDEFRQMSNYLYDVSDGQIRLDTVVILDDKSGWDEADVRIRASNIHGPDAVPAGIHNALDYPVNMPRKWFGNPEDSRNQSYLLHPLASPEPDNFRTIAHEFGHLALGNGDEYRDLAYKELPDSNPPRCQKLPEGNYGFMDVQYANYGPHASEMSNDSRYLALSCQNTHHWGMRHESCWDYFESWAEKYYGGVLAAVLKPDQTDSLERITPAGFDYFPGPNDDLANLNVDCGRLITFPSAIVPAAPENHSMHVTVAGCPVGGVEVVITKYDDHRVKLYDVEQGRTTDGGLIWALGVNVLRDDIEASGRAFKAVGLAKGSLRPSVGAREWLCGQIQLASGGSRMSTRAIQSSDHDSLSMTLRSVAGDFPMICAGVLTGTGWEYGIYFETALKSLPQLDIVTDKGGTAGSIFSAGPNSYGCPVAENLTASGHATVWGVDQVDSAFFFSTPYEVFDISSPNQLTKLIGPGGEVAVSIDSANAGIQRVMILSSAFPPWLNGLNPGSVQAGRTHSLSVWMGEVLIGQNSLEFTYADDDLKDAAGVPVGSEAALRLHRWNGGSARWELVGGTVDTVKNSVYCQITRTGVYGAFTLYGGLSCCVGKRGNVNGQGIVELADLSALVSYLTGGTYVPPCPESTDVDGNGKVELRDLSALINYLTGGGYVLPSCP